MEDHCFYCNFKSEDGYLNGIDRLDNNVGYSVENTVSCCGPCNFMKHALDPITFINRMKHISKCFGGPGDDYSECWDDRCSVDYSSYVYRAQKKNLEVAIDESEFVKLTSSSCHFCLKETTETHLNGVDRKDNNLGYTIDNCLPCCSECNYMKGELSYEDFIDSCISISEFLQDKDFDFRKIKTNKKSTMKRLRAN